MVHIDNRIVLKMRIANGHGYLRSAKPVKRGIVLQSFLKRIWHVFHLLCRSGCTLLNPFLVRALNQSMHIDTGQMNAVGIKAAGGHDLFDFGHTNLAAHGGGWVEVAGGLAEDKVARCIRFPRFDDAQIGKDALFEDIGLGRAIGAGREILVLFAIGNDGAYACLGIKTGDAAAARPHPFGQGALGVELKLQLAGQILAHELGILAHIGGDHFAHLPGLQKNPNAKIIHARIVGRKGQILGARVLDRIQ
mmetsp:Transcript_29414/g.57495  ORF Transcript_29414/g.57495 Transcript_29414/m.57495 type:complete len:249 (+) Transcript_29414:2841-3587(+)